MTSGYQRSTNPEPATPALDRLEARIASLQRELEGTGHALANADKRIAELEHELVRSRLQADDQMGIAWHRGQRAEAAEARCAELERLARDLIDAVKAQDPDLIGNDLGNAIDALEDVLE